jgi:hypothetical protein
VCFSTMKSPFLCIVILAMVPHSDPLMMTISHHEGPFLWIAVILAMILADRSGTLAATFEFAQ